MVNVLPPAVYPVPDASFVVLYAVVAAFRVASEVYKAILRRLVMAQGDKIIINEETNGRSEIPLHGFCAIIEAPCPGGAIVIREPVSGQ